MHAGATGVELELRVAARGARARGPRTSASERPHGAKRKSEIVRLTGWARRHGELRVQALDVLPRTVLRRPPSARLRLRAIGVGIRFTDPKDPVAHDDPPKVT